MMKGLIAGIGMGIVVSGIGLGVLLLSGAQPAGTRPPKPPVTAPPEAAAAVPEPPADPTAGPTQPAAPVIGAPATAPGAAPAAAPAPRPSADTEPAAAPLAEPIAAAPAAPAAGETPGLASAPEAPVPQNTPAAPPAMPAREGEMALAPKSGAPPPSAEPEADVAPGAEVKTAAPSSDVRIAEPQRDEGGDQATDPATEGSAIPNEQGGPAAKDEAATQETVGPVIALQGAAAGLAEGVGDTRVRRPAEDIAPRAEPEGSADAGDSFGTAPLGPNVAAFEAPQGRPLVSVVLIDDGALAGAPEAVAAIGAPVTVAIDPARPDAGSLARTYRDLGLEVAVLPRLPQDAEASDVEDTLEAAQDIARNAVALIDPTGAWQAGGGVAEQALGRLARDGIGFVSISSGLNPGLRAARAEAVPAAIVYRDLDGAGETAADVRRYLDQAAFRARQEGPIVLLGRVRPDTLSALSLWSATDAAQEVALAPLSATLSAGAGDAAE